MNNNGKVNDAILINKNFTPIVTKSFYLMVFLISTCFGIYYGMSGLFIYMDNAKGSHILTILFLGFVFMTVGILFAAHMVRLYSSLEELDNPFSDNFKKILLPISPKWRVREQIIRFAFFAIVSWKAMELSYKFGIDSSQTPDLKSSLLYLLLMYTAMLIWDFAITFAHLNRLTDNHFTSHIINKWELSFPQWATRIPLVEPLRLKANAFLSGNKFILFTNVMRKYTFWKSSLGGLILASVAFYHAPNSSNPGDNTLEWHAVIVAMIIGAMLIYFSLKDTYQSPSPKGILLGTCKHIYKDISAIKRFPYFGHACSCIKDANASKNTNDNICPLVQDLCPNPPPSFEGIFICRNVEQFHENTE